MIGSCILRYKNSVKCILDLYKHYISKVDNFMANNKIKSSLQVIIGGHLMVAGILTYNGDAKWYRKVLMPVCQMLGAESSHQLAVIFAKYGIIPKVKSVDDFKLQTNLWGYCFKNPIGLAAGFDKNGVCVDSMLKMGFGFVEVGSVTPEPQEGNPRPRVFRLKQNKAVINRYGFNSQGHEAVHESLLQRNVTKKEAGILGVNLGKNKTSEDPVNDYVKGVNKFSDVANYLVINISSPNTPGLREMQSKKILQELIDQVMEERNKLTTAEKPPLLVKIAPDLTEQDKIEIASVIARPGHEVDGVIISNTTVSRPDDLQRRHGAETGGLSGQPLTTISTQVIRDMYRLTLGRIPIVGVGGVSSGEDALVKIKAGASLVQLYTALAYDGPPIVNKIKLELIDLLEREGYESVADAVGVDHKS